MAENDDRRYPRRPILGVGALIIRDDDEILIIQRGREPLKGWWSVPGGAVEAGETLENAIKREVLEETGLIVEVVKMAEIFERIMRDEEGRAEYHYVLIDYLCREVGGRLKAADDCSDARWVRKHELGSYRLTEGTIEVIAKVFNRDATK